MSKMTLKPLIFRPKISSRIVSKKNKKETFRKSKGLKITTEYLQIEKFGIEKTVLYYCELNKA
jgi:hypothetical protein